MNKVALPRTFSEHGDEIIINELESAILAAEENCSGDTCTLPSTQHLQIRVSLQSRVQKSTKINLNTKSLNKIPFFSCSGRL